MFVFNHVFYNAVQILTSGERWTSLKGNQLPFRSPNFWKSFSGVFKRGLDLFFLNNFSRFLFFIYLYRIVLFLADIVELCKKHYFENCLENCCIIYQKLSFISPKISIFADKRFSSCYKLAQHWRQTRCSLFIYLFGCEHGREFYRWLRD